MTESLRSTYRRAELAAVERFFAPTSRVLEIGGGSGWQASIMASWGCDVQSIDIEPHAKPHHPVARYDGRAIPFETATFDIVFSLAVFLVLGPPYDPPTHLIDVRPS